MPGLTGQFLIKRDPVLWTAPEGFPETLQQAGLFAQDARHGLEVVLVETRRKPNAQVMRRAWAYRRAGRASPVLLLAFYPTPDGARISLCGPSGEQPVVRHDLEVSQVERLAAVALSEPNHHAATRFLLAALTELDSPVPGLRNVGLLATHELVTGVRQMAEWPDAVMRSSPLLMDRGRRLLERLGYSVEPLGINTSMLTIGGRNRAIAVFCNDDEPFDALAQRFDGTSPVSRGLAVADKQNVDWVILTRASEIRLYAARADTGVGRKGRAETFVELNLSLLPSDQAGYVHLLFSTDALVKGGTFEKILGNSERFAAELATRLRKRIYYDTVPELARAAAERLDHSPSDNDLDDAYEQVMLILFRLLFVAYAEDKDLLPYGTNNHYHHHSLKQIARRLLEDRQQGRDRYDERATAFWDDVRNLWDAVDRGNSSWAVPAYNGGLFSNDPAMSQAGASLSRLRLSDAEFAPVLARLLIDEIPEGEGPVDFRALSVREFGTIYEGLLESRLAVAQDDLTVRNVGGQPSYVPARPSDAVEVKAGSVYLHNRLGVRKSTGSYFTKPFAVEHLLDHALAPALDDHIERLDRLRRKDDTAALAAAFFDFRCADIAMGSGHFLVAALDRIEARLSAWLALHPLPAVSDELNRLRDIANRSLGDIGVGADIESSSLIRRQVARHCIYGVDKNRVSVELARLAIWVHTFVPGLPLSFLDHNLTFGDSLTGIATLDEVVTEFEPDADPAAPSLFRSQLEDLLARSKTALLRLARTSDATKHEIDEARSAHEEARDAVAGARALFDVLTAHRAGACRVPENYDEITFLELSNQGGVAETISTLQPVHFPTTFPEVFLGDRPGFDCVIGNPPWKEATVEELAFWRLHSPGLKALSQSEQRERISQLRRERPDLVASYESKVDDSERYRFLLINGPFPGISVGDPELYQAFCWRFWHLTATDGAIGVVLPRGPFAAKGSTDWRKVVFPTSDTHMVFCKNTDGWLFPDVNPGYQICILSVKAKGSSTNGGTLSLHGVFKSLEEFRRGIDLEPSRLTSQSLERIDSNLCVPTVDNAQTINILDGLYSHPKFGALDRSDWRVRPHVELHVTNDRKAGLFTDHRGAHPVYNHRNIGHLRFEPESGPFTYTELHPTISALHARRIRSSRNKRSAFYRMPSEWIYDPNSLPLLHPRLAFRDVIHSTNPRKIWFALVPARTVLTNKAPYLIFEKGDVRIQAYLLGMMSSSVVDFIGHLFVNLNLNYFILNDIPIPTFNECDRRIDRLIHLAVGLALTEWGDYGEWTGLGTPIVESSQRKDAKAEMDALVSLLYNMRDGDLPSVFHIPTRPSLDRVRFWRDRWAGA